MAILLLAIIHCHRQHIFQQQCKATDKFKYYNNYYNTMKKETIKLTDEEISSIKDIVEDKELISNDKKKDLQKLKTKSSTNDISLGILVIDCYNILELNIGSYSDDENDFREKMKNFISSINIEPLRECLSDYGFGKEFGDYQTERVIKSIVASNRDNYLNLINLFFRITEDV